MAGTYQVVSSYSTNALQGGTRIVPVREIAFTTTPSGVYAEYRIDLSIIDPTQIDGILSVLAENIEVVANRHDVAGMEYYQDVNKAQQLVDFMGVTVQSTSGNSTETVGYPLGTIVEVGFGDAPAGYPSIPEVVARLDAIEAL